MDDAFATRYSHHFMDADGMDVQNERQREEMDALPHCRTRPSTTSLF